MNGRKAPLILLSAMTVLFFIEEAVVNLLPGSRLPLALRQRPLLAVGAFIFALSDFLLARNAVFARTPLSHLISLGVYYAAVGLIALAPWRSAPVPQARA